MLVSECLQDRRCCCKKPCDFFVFCFILPTMLSIISIIVSLYIVLCGTLLVVFLLGPSPAFKVITMLLCKTNLNNLLVCRMPYQQHCTLCTSTGNMDCFTPRTCVGLRNRPRSTGCWTCCCHQFGTSGMLNHPVQNKHCNNKTNAAPTNQTPLCHQVFGPKKAPAVRAWLSRLRTPLLPAAYLFLVLSCFALYTHRILKPLALDHMPIPGLSPITTPCIAILGLLTTLAAYAAAGFTDPGVVTKHNAVWLTQHTPIDPVLWPTARHCTTCHLPRPPRAKHCPSCRVCVARFDHHCMWINGCVGANNLRWFLLFLLSNVLLFGYGVYAGVCYMCADDAAQGCRAVVRGHTSTGMHTGVYSRIHGAWRMVHCVWAQQPAMGQLVLLTGVALLAMALLLAQHTWLLWNGVTSYEVGKLQGVC